MSLARSSERSTISGFAAAARKDPALTAAAVVAVVGLATICAVYFVQYGLGVLPCELCLKQRTAYYVSIPLAFLLWVGAGHGASRKVLVAGLVVVALIMLWNTGLAGYHAGVEWKWWPGPQECTGPIDNFGKAGDLMKSLQHINLVRCDVVSFRFLGLSLAAWDVPASLFLAAVAAWGAAKTLARRTSSN